MCHRRLAQATVSTTEGNGPHEKTEVGNSEYNRLCGIQFILWSSAKGCPLPRAWGSTSSRAGNSNLPTMTWLWTLPTIFFQTESLTGAWHPKLEATEQLLRHWILTLPWQGRFCRALSQRGAGVIGYGRLGVSNPNIRSYPEKSDFSSTFCLVLKRQNVKYVGLGGVEIVNSLVFKLTLASM